MSSRGFAVFYDIEARHQPRGGQGNFLAGHPLRIIGDSLLTTPTYPGTLYLPSPINNPQILECHSTATMAPKGKGADKGAAAKGGKEKGKADAGEEKGGKVKPTQQINVRHILVGFLV